MVFVLASGERIVGRIAVAAPVESELGCACDVVLEGLERGTTIYGATTLQALLLGVRFLGMRLHDHRSRGLRVELVDDAADDVADDGARADDTGDGDVVATLFGPLLRGPEVKRG